MGEFFERGIGDALKTVGMMGDDALMAWQRHRQSKNGGADPMYKGSPYPEKTPGIAAERFARIISEMEDEDLSRQSPDNTHYKGHNNLDRLTSFNSPINIDEGRSAGGFMAPSSPRG